jgi:hypothetical protein
MKPEVRTPIISEGLPVNFRNQTIWRDPARFPDSYMVEVDFDETCYTTFISSGVGIEVHQAYEIAVETVLGEEARQDFSEYGGLSNRAPLDVIEGLIENQPGLIKNALEHARSNFMRPDDISDIGLGIIARFAQRGIAENDELTTRAITEMLVIRKKERLLPQISEEWPLPLGGFEDVWNELHARKDGKTDAANWLRLGAHGRLADVNERWQQFQLAIVSSGHTDFIQKVIELAGLPHADVYMTDDEMRKQVYPRTKPDPYALQLVRAAWMNAYVVPVDKRQSSDFVEECKGRQLYIGDDQSKDGQMAENDGIAFELHNGRPDTWHEIGRKIIDTVESGRAFNA